MENTHPAGTEQNQADTNSHTPGEGAGAEVVADIDALSAQLAATEAKLVEMRDMMLRERAELENQRKRLQRDLEQARRYANERLLSDLLPVCDSLERGLAVESAEATALRAGMDLTLKELIKVAESNGLKALDPLGEAFDPERHQAMSLIEHSEHAPNTVVSVFQKGYVLNERLLRPALVAIAKVPNT